MYVLYNSSKQEVDDSLILPNFKVPEFKVAPSGWEWKKANEPEVIKALEARREAELDKIPDHRWKKLIKEIQSKPNEEVIKAKDLKNVLNALNFLLRSNLEEY